jgi:putative Holliday junction resolvase
LGTLEALALDAQPMSGHVNAAASSRDPIRGTVLAFDFGEKRVGVAVGELELELAHPLATITAASDKERLAAVERLVKEWSPVLFVVGLPMHLDGSDHPLATRCRRFAERLRGRFGRPAQLVDERLTSATASLALAEAGVRGRRQKDMLDQVAAQQILQAYFASRLSKAASPR